MRQQGSAGGRHEFGRRGAHRVEVVTACDVTDGREIGETPTNTTASGAIPRASISATYRANTSRARVTMGAIASATWDSVRVIRPEPPGSVTDEPAGLSEPLRP